MNNYNPEAEKAILGALLLNPACLQRIKERLSVKDFNETSNRHVYQAILDLEAHGNAVDLITLTEELKRTGLLSATGSSGYIANLTSVVPSSGNVEHYAGIVADLAKKRNLLTILSRASKALEGPVMPKDLLKELGGLASDLANGDGKSRSGAVVECLANVEPVKLQWLWPGKIPAGKLTLLVGDPGLGKSVLSLDLAARVSIGAPWPLAAGSADIGDVLILSSEDDPADTIVPRLMAAGADLNHIFILKGIKKDKQVQHFSLVDDLLMLEVALTPQTRLIIIDPISAYLGETDSHVNTSVRSVLAPLAELAGRTGAAVLGISHLNKGQGAAIYRVQGSIAFTAAARAVWAVAKDQADETGRHRLLLPIKCNLAPDTNGLGYELEDAGGQATLHWLKAVMGDASEALTYESKEELNSRQKAQVFLEKLLAQGPVTSNEAYKDAKGNGIAKRTLERAKEDLGIVSKKGIGEWTWQLPGTKEAEYPQGRQDRQDRQGGNVGDLGELDHLQQSSEAQNELFAEKEVASDE